MLQSKKKTEVLETLLHLVNAYSNLFHNGQSYYQDLDVFSQQLGIEIDAMIYITYTKEQHILSIHSFF